MSSRKPLRVVPPLTWHQRDAIVRLDRILQLRRGAVLADEPGLGKTWVAAALASRLSGPEERMLVVVPASLRSWWRRVLSMFDVEPNVVSHESLVRARSRSDAEKPTFVIVDEAHRFRNPRTRRFEGLARLSINARMLLVTATPVFNSPADLAALLSLIAADDELEELGVPSIERSLACTRAVAGVVMNEFVVRHTTVEVMSSRTLMSITRTRYEPVPEPSDLWRQLEGLTFPWVMGKTHRDLVLLCLERRLESSVAALAATLRRMLRVCQRARELATRGAMLSSKDLRAAFGDPDSSTFQDILFPELWGASTEGVPAEDRVFEQELRRLEEVTRTLGPDPKVALLEAIVRGHASTPGLIFTVSCDTAESLFEEMSELWPCGLLTGRRCRIKDRPGRLDTVVEALDDGVVTLVIATDLGAEGLNLQSAGYVVHYDHPWSPAVIEQRNGRICRIGQTRESVESIELVASRGRTHRIVGKKRTINDRLWTLARLESVTIVERTEAEWGPPSRLEPTCPQARLVRQLRARGLATVELVELLSTRYRVGIERLLERESRERPDGAVIDRILAVLRLERAMIAPRNGGI